MPAGLRKRRLKLDKPMANDAEKAIRAALDGRFVTVHRITGELHEIAVPRDYVPSLKQMDFIVMNAAHWRRNRLNKVAKKKNRHCGEE